MRLPTGISEFDRVLGGGLVSGSLVLIGGDPGIGKSCLLRGLERHVVEGGGVYLACRCISYAQEIPYWPIMALLRRLADVDNTTAPGTPRNVSDQPR